MKKLKFQSPYKANGRTRFPEAKQKAGVYIIKENGKIVYVGMSQGILYKTMYRHFQDWNDPTGPRVTYPKSKRTNYTVRIVYTTPAQAIRLEKVLILKYKPRDNKDKFKDYKADQMDKKIENRYNDIPTIQSCPF